MPRRKNAALKARPRQGGRILYGADYNPEQWSPEVWDEDVRLMREARCNVMTVGVFAWPFLEPEEGRYEFGWLDGVIARLESADIDLILATPSAATPHWLSAQYPETVRKGPDNETGNPGYRVNFCPTSPVYRRKAAQMAAALARRYGRHPRLKLWHISNEYYKECHCDLCVAAFRIWLQARYGTLEGLNAAWWTAHWGHTYTDWAQIGSAYVWPRIEWTVFGQRLDWLRFQAAQHLECYLGEKAAITPHSPGVPVTTNAHMTLNGETDWHLFAPYVDVMSWDAYPHYQARAARDLPVALETAFSHDFYRGARWGQPFLRMEGEPCAGTGKRQMRPGILRLTALQALAHGSDSAQFFQWRDGRGGVEKFHGAIVPHSGRADTRIFREHMRLGAALAELSEVAGARTPAQTALIYDKENLWALELATSARGEKRGYVPTCLAHYRRLWERGVPVEVISPLQPFERYKLIIAPLLYMLRPGVAGALRDFVKSGGTLLLTYWSGYVDEHDRVFEGGAPEPLREVLGLWTEELDRLDDGETVRAHTEPGAGLGEDEITVRDFCALIRPEGAQTLARLTEGLYAGEPLITANNFGRGRAYYLGGMPDDSALDAMYERILTEEELRRLVQGAPQEGVTAQMRSTAEAEYIFAQNFNDTAASITLQTGEYVELAADAGAAAECGKTTKAGFCVELPPFSCRVLKKG